jgi:hypothetical protein
MSGAGFRAASIKLAIAGIGISLHDAGPAGRDELRDARHRGRESRKTRLRRLREGEFADMECLGELIGSAAFYAPQARKAFEGFCQKPVFPALRAEILK